MPNPTPNQAGLTKPKWNHQPTAAIRVPECFSEQLLELARELDQEHTQHTQYTTSKNLTHAITLLNESLTLKANSGGAIKQKVKEALSLLAEGMTAIE